MIPAKTLLALAASFCLTLQGQPQITGVVNAATFQPGLPSGGGLATLFCSGVVGAAPGTYLADANRPLPNELAGFTVETNDGYAPLLAVVVTTSGGVTSAQINFQVPSERNASIVGPSAGGGGALYACGAPALSPLPAIPYGAFFASPSGYTAAQHSSDYSTVTPQNPAHPGETIIAYADDAFEVWPPTPIGYPTPSPPIFAQIDGSTMLGNFFDPGHLYLESYPKPDFFGYQTPTTLPLQIKFAGLAPGLIGVQQVNFVVPANQPSGTFSLFFDTGCPKGYTPATGCSASPIASPGSLLPVGN